VEYEMADGPDSKRYDAFFNPQSCSGGQNPNSDQAMIIGTEFAAHWTEFRRIRGGSRHDQFLTVEAEL
jgi:hypothetical protein